MTIDINKDEPQDHEIKINDFHCMSLAYYNPCHIVCECVLTVGWVEIMISSNNFQQLTVKVDASVFVDVIYGII